LGRELFLGPVNFCPLVDFSRVGARDSTRAKNIGSTGILKIFIQLHYCFDKKQFSYFNLIISGKPLWEE